jgi:adenosylcobinamide-GDP ribazoletransferase
MGGFLGAVSLLTRIPVRGDAEGERAVPWFPVVGALLGGMGAGVYAASRVVFGPFVAATLAMAALVLLTGALHEDGLADTADAFGAAGDRERTLEILKDPRHGTYGVLALVMSIVVRIGAVAAMTPWVVAAALPAAQAIGRAAASCVMVILPPANPDGLGATYARRLAPERVIASALAATVIGSAMIGLWTIPAVLLTAAASGVIGRLALTKIGGFTGDVLGAVEQLSEIAVLLLIAAALPHVPWWRH